MRQSLRIETSTTMEDRLLTIKVLSINSTTPTSQQAIKTQANNRTNSSLSSKRSTHLYLLVLLLQARAPGRSYFKRYDTLIKLQLFYTYVLYIYIDKIIMSQNYDLLQHRTSMTNSEMNGVTHTCIIYFCYNCSDMNICMVL